MQVSNGYARTLRLSVVVSAFLVCTACVAVLSRSGTPAAGREAGSVELEGPMFGSSQLTPFPVRAEPSSDDLIAIMRGHGTGDVNADQGLLFAGGAGGSIVRSRLHINSEDAGSFAHLNSQNAARTARGLFDAAERASQLDHRAKAASQKKARARSEGQAVTGADSGLTA